MEGCFYFEVEMLPPKMPLPFFNVQPALRIGFASLDEQDFQQPLGAHLRSYAYSSTGKIITETKSSSKHANEPFTHGDVIGVLISLKPPKPSFLQQNQGSSGLEYSDGSYIEFYKNGKLQPNRFKNIYEGTYFAGISLYMHSVCKVNFGENPFVYPPEITSQNILEQWRPYKEVIRQAKLSNKQRQ